MKRVLAVATAFFSLVPVAYSQGYAGAVYSFTNVDFGCSSAGGCDKSAKGWKFYGGAALSPKNTVDFGIGKISAFEVSYFQFGRARTKDATATEVYYDADNTGLNATRVVPAQYSADTNALSVALVAKIPLVDQVAFSVKAGAAYVTSTYRTEVNGQSRGSETASKLKPYLGLGVEYDIPDLIKLIGTFDITRFDVAGHKGNASMFGLGAEKAF